MNQILTNGDFISGIDKVITGFGGEPTELLLSDDQLDDVVNSTIFNAKMTELSAVSPSGGGASAFIVNINEEGTRWTLGKTWKEIHDAMVDGQTVLVHYSYSNEGYIHDTLYLVDLVEASGDDSISYNVSTGTITYSTNSEDGYPYTSFD